MCNKKQLKAACLGAFLFAQSWVIQASAGEKLVYQNWVVESTANTTEAYTAGDANSSFGLFCSANQCLFYLRQPFQCQPGASYSVLMSAPAVSGALTMQCTPINGNLFQILDPFNTVLNATKAGGMIGFSTALQGGGNFAVTRFSLQGSAEAISRALLDAANGQRRQVPVPAQPMPPQQVLPGARSLQDIRI